MARARTKIDPKTLKQDPLTDMVGRAGNYVSANSNLVLGLGAGLVVALVLLVLWTRGRTERTSTADLNLGQIVAAYSSGEYQPALDLANGVQGLVPGSRPAVLATFYAGKCELQLGRFAEAERSFRAYLEKASKAPLYEKMAHLGLAASLESQGRNMEAATLYQETSAELPEPLASEALLDAARALGGAGDFDQAKRLLEDLVAREGVVSSQAKIELAVLENLPRGTPQAAPTP